MSFRKNLGAAAKIGFQRQRQNYHGENFITPDLQTQARVASQTTGFQKGVYTGAAKAGRVAGSLTNFAAEHPYMASAGAIAGLGTVGMMILSNGNSTDATDSHQAGGVTANAVRNPNVYTARDIDAQLKQRTLKRLNDQISLNHLYMDALNQQ